jgi:hypothetical protein
MLTLEGKYENEAARSAMLANTKKLIWQDCAYSSAATVKVRGFDRQSIRSTVTPIQGGGVQAADD